MHNQLRQQIKKYLLLLLYKWKVSIACLLAAVTLGNVYYLFVPKVYQCIALLRYEAAEKNPADAVSFTNKEKLEDVITILQHLVTDRTSLEEILSRLPFYQQQGKPPPTDEVISTLRGNISLEATSKDTIAVILLGQDQIQVLNTANDLSAGLIEAYSVYRKKQTQATQPVRQESDEVVAAKAVVEEKEAAMAWFRLKHYNEMADQRDSNLSRLNALREQSGRIRSEVKELEAQRAGIKKQVKRIDGDLSVASNTGQPAGNHQQEVGRKGDPSGGGPEGSIVRITDIDDKIQHLQSELQRMSIEIEQYDMWLKAAPQREVEWRKLEGEYELAQALYQSLVNASNASLSGPEDEQKAKESSLLLSNPAQYPTQPVKPNYYLMMLAAFVCGVGMSIAFVLYSELTDRSLKYAYEAEEYLGVSVVSSVPYIGTDSEIKREQMHAGFTIMAFVVYCLALLAALVYLTRNGMIIL